MLIRIEYEPYKDGKKYYTYFNPLLVFFTITPTAIVFEGRYIDGTDELKLEYIKSFTVVDLPEREIGIFKQIEDDIGIV